MKFFTTLKKNPRRFYQGPLVPFTISLLI